MSLFRTYLISFAVVIATLASDTEALHLRCEKTNRPVCFFDTVLKFSKDKIITLETDKNPADITEIAIKRIDVGRMPIELFTTYPNLAILNLKSTELNTLDGILLAENLRDLTVENNDITEIKDGQLGPRVEELQAAGNKITVVEENALKNIVHVELAYNQLKSLPINVFNKSIKMITLDHNELDNVDGLFKGLSKLTYLELSNNKIRQIAEDAFHDCVELNFLHMGHNLIETIPKNLFDGLEKLKKVYLHNNALRVLDLSMSCVNCMINAEYNLLTSVTLSTASTKPVTIFIYMGENSITEVHASKNIRFSEMHLKNNQLATLDISEDQEKLSIVEFSHNNLSHMASSEFLKVKQATVIHVENCSLTLDAIKTILSLPGKKFLVNLAYNPSVATLNWKELPQNPDIYALKVDPCHIANVDVNDIKTVLPHLDKVEASSNTDACPNVESLDINLESVDVKYLSY